MCVWWEWWGWLYTSLALFLPEADRPPYLQSSWETVLTRSGFRATTITLASSAGDSKCVGFRVGAVACNSLPQDSHGASQNKGAPLEKTLATEGWLWDAALPIQPFASEEEIIQPPQPLPSDLSCP